MRESGVNGRERSGMSDDVEVESRGECDGVGNLPSSTRADWVRRRGIVVVTVSRRIGLFPPEIELRGDSDARLPSSGDADREVGGVHLTAA